MMLTGHAYSRSIRGLLLVQLALSKVIFKNIDVTEEEKDVIEDAFLDLYDNPHEKKWLEENDCMKNICNKLVLELEKLEINGPTSKLWIQHFNMVTLLKNFIEAERSGDFTLLNKCYHIFMQRDILTTSSQLKYI